MMNNWQLHNKVIIFISTQSHPQADVQPHHDTCRHLSVETHWNQSLTAQIFSQSNNHCDTKLNKSSFMSSEPCLKPVIWSGVMFYESPFVSLSSISDSVRKKVQKNGNRKKPHVPNTGVTPRLQRASGVIQPNEASCSSESGLSWLQMGQLGDDEKLQVCMPKLCLCIWRDFLWDKETPAIRSDIKTNTQDLQRQESCGGGQDFTRPYGKNLPKSKPERWYTISNQVWEVYWMQGYIPICIKYMLVLFLSNKFRGKLEELV